MSRGPSPSFPGNGSSTMATPLTSTNSSTSTTPTNPSRSTLRVNTDPQLTRFRSNSAQSSSMSPSRSHMPTSGQNELPLLSASSTHHYVSRSLSHAQLSPIYSGGTGTATSMTFDRDYPYSAGRPQQLPPKDSFSMSSSSASLASSIPPNSPALTRIQKALDSSADEGDTLDLSRQGVDRIGDEEVEMFRRGVGKDKKGVWRLALSYNSLRDFSIASSFARLHRLRYLNLKGNQFTVFPQALSEMPSLEILDLSKNSISSFPDEPGRLAQLKVLSLTNNKIYTLPGYLTTFSHLKVFKVDQNPIEWPPREVLGPLVDHDPSKRMNDASSISTTNTDKSRREEDLRPWIENMKSWMRQKAAETDRLLERSRTDDEAYLASEEEPMSAVSVDPADTAPWSHRIAPLMTASSQETVRRVARDDLPPRSSSPRQPLIQRNRSATVSEDSLVRSASPGLYPVSYDSSRHDRSASSSSATSPLSATASSTHSKTPSGNLPLPQPPGFTPSGHYRGASYTATQRLSANLTAKKSLPDLRQSHAKIIADRRSGEKQLEETRPLGLGIGASGSRLRLTNDAWASPVAKSPMTAMSPDKENRRLARKGSEEMLRRIKAGVDLADKRNSQEDPLVDDSRNSYFRRLSTLPVSTISKAIPSTLLKFIDAIRGILFALSQLHSALRQYLVFAVSERVAGVFTRVMEPASNYMMILINALDRFDSMSRRNTPPVQAIRGVLDATKESVAVFAKVVSVLKLQVPALKGGDVRYTRTLLTMIYGSMAEVACSWQSMASLLPEIKSLLVVDGQIVAARAVAGGHKMVPTGSLTGRTPISPIPERGESHSPPSIMRNPPAISTSSPLNESVEEIPVATPIGGKTRRQAGSFSMQDVERGMLMGSPGGPRSTEIPRHRPSGSTQMALTERDESDEEEETLAPNPPFAKKGTSVSSIPSTPPNALQPIAMIPTTSQHSRKGHKPSSSSGSSHALSLSSGLPLPLRKLSVDIRPPTPASATLFDDDLLDVIETATDIAFTVWLKLAEDLGASSPPFSHAKSNSQGSTFSNHPAQSPFIPFDSSRRPSTISPRNHVDLLNLLRISEQLTSTLRDSLMGLRANPHTYNTTTLPDDAAGFIKTVIKVSELVKTISMTHTFPTVVRQSLSKLTQVTRECAILLQVSSLRPGSSTPGPVLPSARSYSPAPFHHIGNHGAGGVSNNSSEDLHAPPQSAGVSGSGWNQKDALRGLQLPSRQMALGRSRSANAVPPAPVDVDIREGGRYHQHVVSTGGGQPRSAQPTQISF